MRQKYGPQFREFNRWFQEHKHLLFCEVSIANGIWESAGVVHHIVRAGNKFSDHSHFWIIISKKTHWYAGRAIQDFEWSRLIEWEEDWIKTDVPIFREMKQGRCQQRQESKSRERRSKSVQRLWLRLFKTRHQPDRKILNALIRLMSKDKSLYAERLIELNELKHDIDRREQKE